MSIKLPSRMSQPETGRLRFFWTGLSREPHRAELLQDAVCGAGRPDHPYISPTSIHGIPSHISRLSRCRERPDHPCISHIHPQRPCHIHKYVLNVLRVVVMRTSLLPSALTLESLWVSKRRCAGCACMPSLPVHTLVS